MTDERLCAMAAAGDERAFELLAVRHRPQLRAITSHYFAPGHDREDLYQAALIGLSKAVRLYAPTRGMTFRGYAAYSVQAEVITAVKAATRLKHRPLSTAVSLSMPIGDDDDGTLADILPGPGSLDPCEILIRREELKRQVWVIRNLATPTERRIAARRLSGLSLHAAGEGLSLTDPAKTADNALQRLREKLAA